MRRDVSITMTGSNGKGVEKLIPFVPNSKAEGGGLTLNKWDENRQANPWVAAQRKSGINGPYMRMSEVYLGYAEVCAALGDVVTGKQYLKTVRERSFPQGLANTDAFIASFGNDLVRAIIEERGFEYAGEGDRRWTLIRSGYLPEDIKRIKDMTKAMMDGLATKGYYEFENGNIISAYIWTKLVDAKTIYGHRLTAQCPTDKVNDPVLYPGWRGQKDNWEEMGYNSAQEAINAFWEYPSDESNIQAVEVSIRKYAKAIIDTLNLYGYDGFDIVSEEEAASLESQGYTKVNWGIDLVDNRDEYDKYLFWDYDYVSAPIYLWPFTPNVMAAGGFTNGYGFKQE